MGDSLLTQKRKNAIRINGPKLLDTLILSPKLFTLLRVDNTLSAHKQEEITLPMLTNDDKIGRLLDFLPKTGNRGFETFIKALVETDQPDVALLLDAEYARPLIDAKTSSREDYKENVNQPSQVVDRGDVSYQSIAEETLDGPLSLRSSQSQQTPNIPPAAGESSPLHGWSLPAQTPNIPPNPTTPGQPLGGYFPGNGMMPGYPMFQMYNPAMVGPYGPGYQFAPLPPDYINYPTNGMMHAYQPPPPYWSMPAPGAYYNHPAFSPFNQNINHPLQPLQPPASSDETTVKQIDTSWRSNNTPAGNDGSAKSNMKPELESGAVEHFSQLNLRSSPNADMPAVTTTEQRDENNETERKRPLNDVTINPTTAVESHSKDQLCDIPANSAGTVSSMKQTAGSESSAANSESSPSVVTHVVTHTNGDSSSPADSAYSSLRSDVEDCIDQPGTRRKPPAVSDLDPKIVNHFPYAAKLLQGRPENEAKELKQFYLAIASSPEMKINIQNVKEEDAVRVITSSEEKLYPLRSRPHKGLVILISIKTFFRHAARDGTETDVTNLTALFKALNFHVELRTGDLTSKGIVSTLQKEAKSTELSKYDAFVLVIMSHGIAGKFYGCDSVGVDIDEIIQLFASDNCPHLAGKPKLFFIQACQGDQKSKMAPDGVGVEDEMDAAASLLNEKLSVDETYKPSLKNTSAYEHDMTHMLIVYATVRGYRAYRYKQLGSCFVRCLVYAFSNFAHKQDVMSIVLYKLNDFMNLIKAYEDDNDEELIHLLAPVQSTLRRKLYLFPGYDGRKFDEL